MQSHNEQHPLISCNNVTKTYKDGNNLEVPVLTELTCAIQAKECVAIVGPSGSGKSTLLHLLGGLDEVTSGEVLCRGVSWCNIPEIERCSMRNKFFGFVYQFHHLLPEFTAVENVAMPMLIQGITTKVATSKAFAILDKVGLSHRLAHKPAQLSGGERQRVAIARALVHEPTCILADEPTGNLDSNTARNVLDLMLELNYSLNTTLIVVTHDMQLAERMNRILSLEGGKLISS